MIVSLTDTTSQEVDARLLALREEGGVVALGRVLILLILTAGDPEEAIAAANAASREHPCRVIVVTGRVDDPGPAGLDAEIRVGNDAGASEVVILSARGAARAEADTLITPLLLPDAPIVVWWPRNPPEVLSGGLLGRLSQRRISDVMASEDPIGALHSICDNYAPGDTDLSWARTTLWRGLTASTLEMSPGPVLSCEVIGNASHPGVLLYAGWLRSRLRVPVEVREDPDASALTGVRLVQEAGTIHLQRPEDSTTLTISTPSADLQHVSLPQRTLLECLVEELRRLDPDETYASALSSVFEVELT